MIGRDGSSRSSRSILLVLAAVAAVSMTGAMALRGPAVEGSRIYRGNDAPQSGRVGYFPFDGSVRNAAGALVRGEARGEPSFVAGLEQQALRLGRSGSPVSVALTGDRLPSGPGRDFSVQFWLRTVAEPGSRFVVLSQKRFPDNSLASHKQAGWVFLVSGGTWAWNMGSGSRRITYERENGTRMPLNDGRWHQLTMTYSAAESVVRLYYDGDRKASYNVADSRGFDFAAPEPVVVGWGEADRSWPDTLPAIEEGAAQLQALVDAFNAISPSAVGDDELLDLIVDPRRLFDRKVEERAAALRGADSLAFRETMSRLDWQAVSALEAALMDNPYTVHQVLYFMETAPLRKAFALVDGTITIRADGARTFAEGERLHRPEFDLDELAIWDRTLSPAEVRASYAKYFMPAVPAPVDSLPAVTVAAWNIWHGGRHFTIDEHGWDSRVAIAEILRRENVDVLMMQETYSSGDFIAAELDYDFATTVDRDYLNQGANISVLSRYPIEEVFVHGESPFMNVGVRIAISGSQDLYAMSNWYGMQQFPAVFEFHQSRFAESDAIPTVFGGDFNAVPHTDGGESPASQALLDTGFTDAWRSLHPDVARYPGHTHRSGRRIDQLHYKGRGLKNTETRIVSSWPPGFPSDHFLIVSTFDLGYATRRVR